VSSLSFGICKEWDLPPNFANIYMSVSIVAKQLGFDSVILYLECHGWIFFWTQGGKATIQYRKLEQVITCLAPTGGIGNELQGHG
jgi:hypothetical protein